MNYFTNGNLDPQMFDTAVRQATHDFSDVLAAAVRTQSARIETTHFLIALARVPGGATQKHLASLGLTVEQWESGLAGCATHDGGLPPTHLAEKCCDSAVARMLSAAESYRSRYEQPRVSEAVLLLSALENLTPDVTGLFKDAEVDGEHWRERLMAALEPIKRIEPFESNGALALACFSPGAKKVLRLMRTEAESLGYDKADPRHLLLGLVACDGGATQYGLYHQGVTPKKVQEAAMISLRNRARKTRSSLTLDRDHLQPLLQRILISAGEVAGGDRTAAIAEPHVLRALLGVESVAQKILADEKADLAALRATAEGFDLTDDKEDDSSTIADISTVRERLRTRLVGQDDTIERILPYIQRMRFGFSTPGRPVGVFLFCGQSGSGKTEMAKELARAVYGSEENLIFLEMGQFNSAESMNIFVGSPPGYVGYGEGKLTNGLRDKPRSVVLFDEVEKANPRVLDALLRFVDEGRIDDPAGPVRDGTQCLVILTSNIGSESLSELWTRISTSPNWRTEIRKQLREEFKKNKFRVEFLNRFDEIILFHTLAKREYEQIAQRLLEKELGRLKKERQIEVAAQADVAAAIADYCQEIGEGARAVRRLVQSMVITPVIDFVLANACTPPIRLSVKAHRASQDPDCEPSGKVAFAEATGGREGA